MKNARKSDGNNKIIEIWEKLQSENLRIEMSPEPKSLWSKLCFACCLLCLVFIPTEKHLHFFIRDSCHSRSNLKPCGKPDCKCHKNNSKWSYNSTLIRTDIVLVLNPFHTISGFYFERSQLHFKTSAFRILRFRISCVNLLIEQLKNSQFLL